MGKVSRAKAEAKSAQVHYLLMPPTQGLIALQPGADIVRFVEHDGKPPQTAEATPDRKALALDDLRLRYLATYSKESQQNTLITSRIHFAHLVATLGGRFPLAELKAPTDGGTSTDAMERRSRP